VNQPYPHPKPQPPAQLYLLATLAAFGLAALFLAAFNAFQMVAAPPQAFFAACLIEAGLVVEALALMRRPRSAAPWIGLAISYIVSARYNTIQAAAAAPQLDPFSLYALALGPLSALAFVSLTLGSELRRYQGRAAGWQADRAAWEAQQAAEAAEYRRQQAAEERDYRRRQDELARKRRERREREREQGRTSAERPANSGEPTNNGRTFGERSADYDELLGLVRERSGGQPFGPADVQDWLSRGKTAAYQVLSYGQEMGDIDKLGRGQYAVNGHTNGGGQ
jgi:hypothetical protein